YLTRILITDTPIIIGGTIPGTRGAISHFILDITDITGADFTMDSIDSIDLMDSTGSMEDTALLEDQFVPVRGLPSAVGLLSALREALQDAQVVLPAVRPLEVTWAEDLSAIRVVSRAAAPEVSRVVMAAEALAVAMAAATGNC
ncbi:MAG TPA: hypothetical protein VL793_02080, partial [Patescibacteria group bacterium]|nr:hypothetical protein [Patescibacteria group bacterium]